MKIKNILLGTVVGSLSLCIIRKSKGLLFQNEAFYFSLGFQNEAFNFHQNTSVTQTTFKWHLNDAFCLIPSLK